MSPSAGGLGAIDHLILLMLENRSFDHYLGALALPEEGRSDITGLGATLPAELDQQGAVVTAWPMDGTPPEFDDPPHGYAATHLAYDGGRNDAFVRQYQAAFPQADPRLPLGYYTRRTLPVYYALADRFTVCDHWFSSLLSSTWPNRKYLHSGCCDADLDTQTLPAPPGFRTRPIYDAIERTTDARGNALTWRCYFSDLPFLAFWYEFAATHLSHFHPVAQFVTDCQQDSLPAVTVIDPPFTLADDHPPHDPRLGQKFVGLIVDALTHSASWARSALVIVYDEHGGFADQVPPPACFETPPAHDPVLGFRVPALVVSPYARRRYACKTVLDHTTILKSIQSRWNVPFGPEFGTRWPHVPDIWRDCFDFGAPPLPQGTYTGEPLRTLTWGSGIHRRFTRFSEGFEALLERIFVLPELKALDRRADVFHQLNALEQAVITRKRML